MPFKNKNFNKQDLYHTEQKQKIQPIIDTESLVNIKIHFVFFQKYEISAKKQQKVYDEIIQKQKIRNNYAGDLAQLIQKFVKVDMKLNVQKTNNFWSKIEIFIEKQLFASSEIKNSYLKDSKQIFCYKLLQQNFSEFLQKKNRKMIQEGIQIQKQRDPNIARSEQSPSQRQNAINQNSHNDQKKLFLQIFQKVNNIRLEDFELKSFTIKNSFQFCISKKYKKKELSKTRSFYQLLQNIFEKEKLNLLLRITRNSKVINFKFYISNPHKKQISYRYQQNSQKSYSSDYDYNMIEIISLIFIKDFMPSIYKMLQDDIDSCLNQEISEQKFEANDFFDQNEYSKCQISKIQIDGEEILSKNYKLEQISDMKFGNYDNFQKLKIYFAQQNTEILCNVQKNQQTYDIQYKLVKEKKEEYIVKMEAVCDKEIEAKTICEAKFIEIVFGDEFLENFLAYYYYQLTIEQERNMINHQGFFFQEIQINNDIKVNRDDFNTVLTEIKNQKNNIDYTECLQTLFETNYIVSNNMVFLQNTDQVITTIDLEPNQHLDFKQDDINFITMKKNVQKAGEFQSQKEALYTKIVIKTKVNNNLQEVEEVNLKFIVLCLLEDIKRENFSQSGNQFFKIN